MSEAQEYGVHRWWLTSQLAPGGHSWWAEQNSGLSVLRGMLWRYCAVSGGPQRHSMRTNLTEVSFNPRMERSFSPACRDGRARNEDTLKASARAAGLVVSEERERRRRLKDRY